MDKLIKMESQAKRIMELVDDVLRTGDQQLKEVHLLQDFVNNAPVEVPDEIKSIVNDAAAAIEARSEKLREYLTNPESEVHVSDLILTDVLDGLLQRARDFVTKIGEEDDEMDETALNFLEEAIRANDDELEKMSALLNALPKLDASEIEDTDKFTLVLKKLIAALTHRGDVLRECKNLPVKQWPDMEDMLPYYMDMIKTVGPDLGTTLLLNTPDERVKNMLLPLQQYAAENVEEDDDSASDEDMKLLERSIKMNKEQLGKVHETLDVARKSGCPSLDAPDKFIDALEKLVGALQSRGDDLEMCKALPVEQWPDPESMTPYYMDIIKAAGPAGAAAMAEALCTPDLAELSAEDGDEDKEKCKTVEVKVCDGQLKVVTEGFTPEEHGRIERFFAREFDYPLEQDEQEADGIFAETDKEHLSRIKSFFASERDEVNFKDAVAAIELELAEHMNNAESVGVPYVVDGIKHLVNVPLDTALDYWKSRGTDAGLFNLIGIIDLTRQIHNDMYGEYIPLSDKFKLDSEFVKCEGVYKLIYDMNK